MKIAFIRHSLLNRGGDKMVLEYAGYLAGRGHEVVIWLSRQDTVFEVSPLIEIKSLSAKSKLATILKVIFTKFPSDLIISDIIAMTYFLSFRNSGRLVYFAQDYDEYYYRLPLIKWLIRFFYFYCLKLRHIPAIAVSDNLGNLLRNRFAANAKVVFNGINFGEFYREEDKGLLQEKGGRQAVLIFARRDFRKGADIASQAIKDLAKTGFKDSIMLWIIGEDTALISELPVKKFGFVKADTLRKIFSSADAFLLPSRHEGFGLMVLQAIACGCPVLTTVTSGIVENDKDALLSPAGDVRDLTEKLARLLRDKELRDRLRGEGYRMVKRYDLSVQKQQFERSIMALQERG